jgi:hypothetical protein
LSEDDKQFVNRLKPGDIQPPANKNKGNPAPIVAPNNVKKAGNRIELPIDLTFDDSLEEGLRKLLKADPGATVEYRGGVPASKIVKNFKSFLNEATVDTPDIQKKLLPKNFLEPVVPDARQFLVAKARPTIDGQRYLVTMEFYNTEAFAVQHPEKTVVCTTPTGRYRSAFCISTINLSHDGTPNAAAFDKFLKYAEATCGTTKGFAGEPAIEHKTNDANGRWTLIESLDDDKVYVKGSINRHDRGSTPNSSRFSMAFEHRANHQIRSKALEDYRNFGQP